MQIILTQTGVIYGLFDPRDGQLRYVGQTIRDLRWRLKEHRNDVRRWSKRLIWIKHLKKLGLKPVVRILAEHPLAELDDAEIQAIAAIRSTGAVLFNLSDGGHSNRGCIPSAATRAKRSAALMGRKRPPEAMAGMIAYHRGKKHTPEHRAKIRAKLLGSKRGPETGRRISESLKGHGCSAETKAKISAANTGKRRTPEERARLSVIHKISWQARRNGI